MSEKMQNPSTKEEDLPTVDKPMQNAEEEKIPSEQGEKHDKKSGKRLSAEEALQHFDNVNVEAPKKRRFGWVGNVLLAIVIGLSVWMMLEIVMSSGAEAKSLKEIIAAGNWRFALITLAVMVVILSCICLEYVTVLKATTGKCHFGTGVKVAFLGKFYDNITPFATGGQPMQIYYLHKKGLSGGLSSAVVFIKYFVWMLSWLFVSLILMACNTGVIARIPNPAWRTIILVFGWVGLGINMLLPFIVLLFVLLPKFSYKVASAVVGAGAKIKIVKDREKALKKADKLVNDFRSSFIIMSRRPLLFIVLILLCITEVSLTFALPFFIMRTLSGIATTDAATLFSVTALNIYVIMAVSVIPTPGNTGAMEGLGALAFTVFVTGSVQFWSMIGWRFTVYYIYIIIGLGVTVFDFIRRLVVHSREKKLKKDENIGITENTENGSEQDK